MAELLLASAAAFNLICIGSGLRKAPDGELEKVPFSQEYRIDLEHRRWCDGKCEATFDIVRFDDRRIVLSETADSTTMSDLSINRESGQLLHMIDTPFGSNLITADCAPRAFMGFPVKRF